jgi:hypothetical protein
MVLKKSQLSPYIRKSKAVFVCFIESELKSFSKTKLDEDLPRIQAIVLFTHATFVLLFIFILLFFNK